MNGSQIDGILINDEVNLVTHYFTVHHYLHLADKIIMKELWGEVLWPGFCMVSQNDYSGPLCLKTMNV